MDPRFPHAKDTGTRSARIRPASRAARSPEPARHPTGWVEPVTTAERACCCPARPVARVVMAPSPSRPRPVDLLLCGHHYRASRHALAAAGVAVDVAAELSAAIDPASPARRGGA